MSYIKMVFFCAVIIVTFRCSSSDSTKQWLGCSTVIDTINVDKDWNRGAYLIQDSLVLSANLHPFDTIVCSEIGLRIKPIVAYDGIHVCTIGDLYPPFKIYKPNESDTLIVIKGEQVIFFQIPHHFCE